MKKITICTLLAVLTGLVLLSACGTSAQPADTPEPLPVPSQQPHVATTAPESEPDESESDEESGAEPWNPYTCGYDMSDFILSNGIYLGMNYEQIAAEMGEPNVVYKKIDPYLGDAEYILFYGDDVFVMGSDDSSKGIEDASLSCVQLRSEGIATARGVDVGDDIVSVCEAYGFERESPDSEFRFCGNWQRVFGPVSDPSCQWRVNGYDEILDFSDLDMPIPAGEGPLQALFFMFTDDELTSVMLRSNVATDWKPPVYPPADDEEWWLTPPQA